jgi:hypothetical protein
MTTKTIKIFIASSAELKEDRDELRLFLSVENDRLHEQGVYLQLVQWEYFSDAISPTRLQDEYNKALQDCDIVLSLFFTKAGKYTQEEFDVAYQYFKTHGKPTIFTYFKEGDINTANINEQVLSLLNFKQKLIDLGHFPTHYKNIDDLKNQFKSQLERIIGISMIEKMPEAQNSTTITGNNNITIQGVTGGNISINTGNSNPTTEKNVIKDSTITVGGNMHVGDVTTTNHNQNADKIYNIEHIDNANFS